uniref:Uncharacterized protein n=1 Tax=Anguilla anguilla TaxID=7936 RepID=A0A0E9SIK7_ANGAN
MPGVLLYPPHVPTYIFIYFNISRNV